MALRHIIGEWGWFWSDFLTIDMSLKFVVLIITLIAIIDILSGKFKKNKKYTWLFIVILFNVIGVLAYLIFRKEDRL